MMDEAKWDILAKIPVEHKVIWADELYANIIEFAREMMPESDEEQREFVATLFKVMINDAISKGYDISVEAPRTKVNKCRDCEYLEVARMYKGKDGKLKGSGECAQRPKKRDLHKKSYTAFSNTACKNFKQRSIPISLEVEHDEESV